MIRLTEEMCQLINNARANGNPCIVATASPEGTPNVGYIGTVLAMDEVTFAYRSRDGRYPLENIEENPEENPKVVLLFRDSARDTGWKFRCTAAVHRDGSEYDNVITRLVGADLISDPGTKTAAVVLQIDQVLTLFGEVLQERVPGMRW